MCIKNELFGESPNEIIQEHYSMIKVNLKGGSNDKYQFFK